MLRFLIIITRACYFRFSNAQIAATAARKNQKNSSSQRRASAGYVPKLADNLFEITPKAEQVHALSQISKIHSMACSTDPTSYRQIQQFHAYKNIKMTSIQVIVWAKIQPNTTKYFTSRQPCNPTPPW